MRMVQVPASVAMLANGDCSFSTKDEAIINDLIRSGGNSRREAIEYIKVTAPKICEAIGGLKVKIFNSRVDRDSFGDNDGFPRISTLGVAILFPKDVDKRSVVDVISKHFGVVFKGNIGRKPMDPRGFSFVYFHVTKGRLDMTTYRI